MRESQRELIFRVFVSSTFNDMIAERNALHESVFPKLRDYCQERGAQFQTVDLRWGISEESALDQQTMSVCAQELARCHERSRKAYLLILLGQRYGWRPLPARIPAEEFEEILRATTPALRDLLTGDCPPAVWRTNAGQIIRVGWYRKDLNAEPPEYVLQPRVIEYPGDATVKQRERIKTGEAQSWCQIEAEVRSRIAAAISRLGWPKDDVRRAKYEQSATHQEIAQGLLNRGGDGGTAFAYLRRIIGTPEDGRADEFVDSGAERLCSKELEKALRKRLPRARRRHRNVDWSHIEKRKSGNAAPACEDLADLCDWVFEAFKHAIDAEFKESKQRSDLELEREAHRVFGRESCVRFVGRHDVLNRIARYLSDPKERQPLIIHGRSGCGKTGLIARAISELEPGGARTLPEEVTLAYRFIGATPISTGLRGLLGSLGAELLADVPPPDIGGLVAAIRGYLSGDVGRATREGGAAVIFLDGLDQLNEADDARALEWIPGNLGYHAKLILTVAEAPAAMRRARHPLLIARDRWPDSLIELGDLSMEEAETALSLWLGDAQRTLQDDQKREVLSKISGERNPLFLKVAFEQVRRWHSWDRPGCGKEGVTRLSDTVDGVVADMLRRLEMPRHHGRVLVEQALANLAAAKNGLTEDELLDALSQQPGGVMEDYFARNPASPKVDTLPMVIWSRLLADLQPHMTQRRADGTITLGFYHRQVQEAVERRYLTEGRRCVRHNVLARHFRALPNWVDAGHELVANRRKMSELTHHLSGAALVSELRESLCDLDFLSAQCVTGRVYDLLKDYRQPTLPETSCTVSMRNAIASVLEAVLDRPGLAAPLILNGFRWVAKDNAETAALVEPGVRYLDGKGGWLSATAPFLSGTDGEIAVSFSFEADVQPTFSQGDTLAVANRTGRAEVWNLKNSERMAEYELEHTPVHGIAASGNGRHLAYIDSDGIARTPHGQCTIQCRKGERVLAFCSPLELLVVAADGNLVVWDFLSGDQSVVFRDLPESLAMVRIGDNGRKILAVAGQKQQVLLLLQRETHGWRSGRLQVGGPLVSHCDLSEDGRTALLAGLDRRLQVIDVVTQEKKAELYYERHKSVHAVGTVVACTLARGADVGRAYFVTIDGRLLRWGFRQGNLERIADCWSRSERARPFLLGCLPGAGTPFLTTNAGATSPAMTQSRQRIPRHEAPVSRCFVTDDGAVVSMSVQDQTVRWFAVDGGRSLCEEQHVGAPSAMAQSGRSSDALLGDSAGMIFNVSRSVMPRNTTAIASFGEQINSLLDAGNGIVIAAGRSGTIKRIHPDGSSATLFQSVGMTEQRKICSAGRHAECWSWRREATDRGTRSVVSLVRGLGEETLVFSSYHAVMDFAATDDGSRACVAGSEVGIIEDDKGQWHTTCVRHTEVTNIAFVRDGRFLAVTLATEPWLELWRADRTMATVAAFHIESEASCLTAGGDRIIVGCKSGDLVCLRIRGLPSVWGNQ